MKTFHATFTTAKNDPAAKPYLVVAIAFGSGTKYYCEKVVATPSCESELLLSASTLAQAISEENGQAQGISFELSDADKALLVIMRAERVYKIPVTVYQCFDTVTWANSAALWHGEIKTATRQERTESVIFACDPGEANIDARIGTNTAVTTAAKEGEILPLIYGHVVRSKCVQTIEAKRTTLAVPLAADSSVAIVADSSEFAQNTLMNLRIGYELVRGQFDGKKLTISQRNIVVASGTIGYTSPNTKTFRATLSPAGPSWIGYYIQFFTPSGILFHAATITNYTAPDTYGKSASEYITAGTKYRISEYSLNHPIGETVVEKLSSYKWVINDAVSTAVDRLEMLGSVVLADASGASASSMGGSEQYVEIPAEYYTVNLNDAGQTTVTLPWDPANLRNHPYTGTDLLATLTGINYSNPVEIIVALAQKFGLTYPGDFDLVTEASEKALCAWHKMGLRLQQKLTFDVIYDIAFQARLSIRFAAGKLAFKYLTNAAGASVKTISDATREFDSYEITQDEVVANSLEVVYGSESKKFALTDAASIAAYGEKNKSINLWAIQEKNYAQGIANFWLRRWAYPLERAKVATFLNSAELEINDWVTLDTTDLYASQLAEVVGVEHAPSGSAIDRIEYDLRLPRWAGCATTCEQYEQTGCASNCEQYCTSSAETSCGYACETSTQDACSLTCVVNAELVCVTYLQLGGCVGCVINCQAQCMTSCVSSGEGCSSACEAGSCQTGEQDSYCAVNCEISCVVACEDAEQACSGDCESSCRSSCMSGIEAACATGAEGCSTSCQGGCQTGGCETSGCTAGGCQTGGEATACGLCCQVVCTSSCENFCTAGTCQDSCTSDLMHVSFSNCSESCEISCRGQCEGQCQDCCQVDGSETGYICASQCQTGCIQNCETSPQSFSGGGGTVDYCATACQGYCQTDAQTGCALYCTTGCVCACTLSCEGGSCRTGCEQLCQCQCQTNAESHCNIGTEACYSDCQASFCQTSDQTGACVIACQAYCQSAAQDGCSLYCTVGCMCDCTSVCQSNCRTGGCETKCECLCQTALATSFELIPCGTSCRIIAVGYSGVCMTTCTTTCTTTCRDWCQSKCTTSACVVSCQAYCQGASQAGCALYCTIGCMCDCTSVCQLNCRTATCETTCICLCQTAAQV